MQISVCTCQPLHAGAPEATVYELKFCSLHRDLQVSLARVAGLAATVGRRQHVGTQSFVNEQDMNTDDVQMPTMSTDN